MAALTASAIRDTVRGSTIRIAGRAAASLTFYRGAWLVIDGGDLALPTDAAGKVPVGYYTGHGVEPGDESITTGASGLPTIEFEQGLIWAPFSGAAQSDVGLLFYLADSGTVTKTAGSKTIAVRAVGFRTGEVLLDFRHTITP
jgi:hypothetical protein